MSELRLGRPASEHINQRNCRGDAAQGVLTTNTERNAYAMKDELGLLWIPVGFVFMIVSIAALFLTVLPA